MIKKIAMVLSAVLILGAASASAESAKIPGRTPFHVNDYAGVLEERTKSELEQRLSRFKRESPQKVEMIVTTFKTIGEMPFDQFVNAYVRKWRRLWPFEKDHQVHLIVVVLDGKMRIGVGHPLREILTAEETQRLIKEEILPRFSRGRFNEGILEGSKAIINNLESEKR